MAILKELWSEEISDDEVLSTYQIDLRERLEQICKFAQDNLKRVQGKQKTYYDRCARSNYYENGKVCLKGSKYLIEWITELTPTGHRYLSSHYLKTIC